jgi:hypothetical protein
MRISATRWVSGTVAVLALLGADRAAARIVVAESLEWLADSSHHIAVAEISRTVDLRWEPGAEGTQPDYPETDYPLIVTKTTRPLKGNPPEEMTFSWRLACAHWHWPPPKKARMLLFLDGNEEVFDIIQLTVKDCHPACSADFRTLEKPKEILAFLERRLRLKQGSTVPARPPRSIFFDPPPRPRRYLVLEIPSESPAFKALWSLSSCFLIVPADPERKAEILEATRAEDCHVRAAAAHRLGAYPPDGETIRILKKLLEDPGESRFERVSGQQRLISVYYPARQSAFETLLEIGVQVPKPEGYVEDVPASFVFY